MDFADVTWLSAVWLLVPPIVLELWLRIGPKGRRTQTTMLILGALGFVETSGLADVVPENQWSVILIAIGYVGWRLRQVTTTPAGRAT